MSLCVEGLLGLLERQLLQCFAECLPDLPCSVRPDLTCDGSEMKDSGVQELEV